MDKINAMIALDGPCSVLRPKNTNLLTDVRAVQRIMSLVANLSVHTTSTKYKINFGQLTPIWISWNWPKTSAWIRELSAQNCSLESEKIRPDLIDWNTEEECVVLWQALPGTWQAWIVNICSLMFPGKTVSHLTRKSLLVDALIEAGRHGHVC